jgi:tetratricopeptide (TPR) repeat protein
MSTTLSSKAGNQIRLGLLAASVALTWGVAPAAHAQWGGLLNNLLQQGTQARQQQQAKQAAEEAKLGPRKKWGTPKAVPAALQAQASTFAQGIEPAELRPLFERLYIEGERNATLNLQRIGLAALALGRLDMAEKALDGAAFRIDVIYADNPEAQKAKSLWNAEKVKDFKGEPYERAMNYFYRGLAYAARGDFQNARAMFKQADYQDTVAESEQYAGDFALMPYMAGWASYCDGDSNMAKDFLKQAIKGDAKYADVSVEQPVVVLFETGRTPFKFSAGKHDELLKWQPHPLPEQTVSRACAADGSACFVEKMVVGADIGFQAMTRGGRPVDAIMNGKAAFKEGADTVATVGNAVGQVGLHAAALSGSRDMGNLGLLGSLTSIGAMGVSAATQTQADIREWEQLPGTVWLGTAAALQPAATGTVAVTTTGSGEEKLGLSRLVNTQKCQLYWGRSLTPLSLLSFAGPIEPGEHGRDPAFRQAMSETFAAR